MYPIMIDRKWPVLSELEKRRLESQAAVLPLESRLSFRKWLDGEITYTSIAIEGNTLSRRETALVLNNEAVGGKSVTEHLEAHNHQDALQLMYSKAAQAGMPTLDDIYELNGIILRGIKEEAGQLRTSKIRIMGAEVHPPAPAEVPAKVQEFGEWLQQETPSPEAAFKAHLWLVDIHPFVDGNGRTARLLTNLILGRAGHLPTYVELHQRDPYFSTIQTFCEMGDCRPFVEFMGQRLLETYDHFDQMRPDMPMPDRKIVAGPAQSLHRPLQGS